MKISTTTTLVAAVAALTIASLDVVVPRAVRAAVTTLIRDQDNAARHPFTTLCVSAVTTNAVYQCETPFVPAGEEVVVETVAIRGFANPQNSVVGVQLDATTAGQTRSYAFGPISDSGLLQPQVASFVGIQPLHIYADPGTAFTCSGQTAGGNPVGFQVVCTISGYYVTLP